MKTNVKRIIFRSSPIMNTKFFNSNGRFQILPAFKSLRKQNPTTNRSVSLIIEEEVKNAIEMQAKSRSIERRGSLKISDVKNNFKVDWLGWV